MHDTTPDLLSRIETLEARLRILEATQSAAADTATGPTPTERITAEPSSRRDLLRYGAVALAGAAAGMTGSPVVEAADGGAVVIGATAAEAGLDGAQTARLIGFDEVQTVIAAAVKLQPFDPSVAVAWAVAAAFAVQHKLLND